MVEMLVMKNPDLFKENRPVEVEFFSRDETGKGRAQARTVSQCFDPDWGAAFFFSARIWIQINALPSVVMLKTEFLVSSFSCLQFSSSLSYIVK
jgi:hypothetical protein